MPIRVRNGKLEWRFWVDGHEWSHLTDLADTERNRTKCSRQEAEARRLVLDGRGDELRLQIQPFSDGADAFVNWCKGEYSAHPNSWKRIAVSITSLKKMWGKRPVSSLTAGDVEDYKAWRRNVCQVREVTLRHDLHSLSLLFQFAMKHNWAKLNPVEKVDIPSDADAVRINVLSPAQEAAYFSAIEVLRLEKIAKHRPHEAQGYQDMHDLHRLMILQGCRPEELRELTRAKVDIERGCFTIARGKSVAAARTLKMRAESRSIFAARIARPTLGPWVFPSPQDHNRHMGSAQRLHDSAVRRSGVSCVPYDFRHTAATRWAEAGIDIVTIAAWLGHSNLRSIQKYVHPSRQHLDAQMDRYESIVEASATVTKAEPPPQEKVN